MQSLFGTSGIRGNAEKVFTNQFCFDLGLTFAQFLEKYQQSGPIAVGIDSRQSSPRIASHITSGLTKSNRQVLYLGCLPVPACHYAILSTQAIASIMVTGSHIDKDSNGVKFFAFKEEIDKDHEKQITNIYSKLKHKTTYSQQTSTLNIDTSGFNNYLELLLSLADKPLPVLKIVLDPGNGAQTEITKTVLEQLNQKLTIINGDIQKDLISRDTETDGSFKDLQKQVLKHQADLGIGFDSDGDRVIFVDRQGKFIPGDYSGTLIAKYHSTDTIVTPINTSNIIDSINKKIIRTKVGSPYVVAAMKKYDAGFGFESNGGGVHQDIMLSRDGGTTMIKLLNILKWTKKDLTQLISEFPQYFIRRQKFDCPRDKNQLILDQAKNFTKTQKIDTTDGIKLIINHHDWVLFRPSSNAPEFRVFVQSDNQTKADSLLNQALEFAQKLIQ